MKIVILGIILNALMVLVFYYLTIREDLRAAVKSKQTKQSKQSNPSLPTARVIGSYP